jgi:phosphoadenosine phosphosulfate reductase
MSFSEVHFCANYKIDTGGGQALITYHCKKCNIETKKSECNICGERTSLSSKLYWCNECNIPIYTEKCPICDSDGEYFTTDARPVFPEERLLIESVLNVPMRYYNHSVWNSNGTYFVDGKKIKFSIANLKNIDSNTIRATMAEYNEKNTYEYFDNNIAAFIRANKIRFDDITSEAMNYVVEASKGFDSTSMFVSFSGGKDSTVTSHLVTTALCNPSIIHIFGNTTIELPTTIEYVNRFKKENRRTPLLTSMNDQQDFFELCKEFGPPSRMLRWCCTVFKTGFISKRINSTFKNKKSVRTFYGIRRNESKSRSTYSREDNSPKISKQMVASPIIDWMDFDVWLYILSTGIDFNDAYRKGYARVGCWCCPNNSRWSQFLASVYFPELDKKFNDILYDFAVKMGKTDPEEYVINGGWKARSGGAGIDRSKKVAIEFKPCATDESSFNYELNKPITEQLYEFFKPFGVLNFDMGNKRLGEVYILDFKTNEPLLKLQGRIGTNTLRITILKKPIAKRTKTVEIELKFKCQITKYQLCTGCHACETACKHNAITLVKEQGTISDYSYYINDNACVRCTECINHYQGGCYMRRVLLPRGKDYKGK